MAVKKVVQYGDKILSKRCRKVDTIDDKILEIVKDLKDTLDSCEGIGLAAPQIGVLKRIIRIDLKDDTKPVDIINPEIVKKIGRETSIEGCLSYVGYEGEVIRPKKVVVKGLAPDGSQIEFLAEGLLAKAFCHEIDHLNGIMYMDIAKKVYKIEDK